MNWLHRLIDAWAARRQTAEIQSMLAILAKIPKNEMAELVVLVHHVKAGMQQEGNDVMRPTDLIMKRPDMALTLTRSAVLYRKQGNARAAAAFMVWAHTMRSAIRPSLVPLARQLWREVGRGFDGVEYAATDLSIRLQTEFKTDGATEYPVGLDPRS